MLISHFKAFILLMSFGILIIDTTIVQAANFDFKISVEPDVLYLGYGGQGTFTITLEDKTWSGGDVTLSVITDDVGHNVYGVGLQPNPVRVPRGGKATATWKVATVYNADFNEINVHFKGDPPGITRDAYAVIKLVNTSNSVSSVSKSGSSMSNVSLMILSIFLIVISNFKLREEIHG